MEYRHVEFQFKRVAALGVLVADGVPLELDHVVAFIQIQVRGLRGAEGAGDDQVRDVAVHFVIDGFERQQDGLVARGVDDAGLVVRGDLGRAVAPAGEDVVALGAPRPLFGGRQRDVFGQGRVRERDDVRVIGRDHVQFVVRFERRDVVRRDLAAVRIDRDLDFDGSAQLHGVGIDAAEADGEGGVAQRERAAALIDDGVVGLGGGAAGTVRHFDDHPVGIHLFTRIVGHRRRVGLDRDGRDLFDRLDLDGRVRLDVDAVIALFVGAQRAVVRTDGVDLIAAVCRDLEGERRAFRNFGRKFVVIGDRDGRVFTDVPGDCILDAAARGERAEAKNGDEREDEYDQPSFSVCHNVLLSLFFARRDDPRADCRYSFSLPHPAPNSNKRFFGSV